MRVIRGLYNLPGSTGPTAATIGNFDGVHLGHQSILRQLTQAAEGEGLSRSILLFEPQPAEFFTPDKAPARLYRCREKLACLQAQRDAQTVDQVVLLRFNQALASIGAQDFVEHILLDRLQVRHLLVGDDFRFGRGRAGDYELLKRLSIQHGFNLERLDSVCQGDERISSTAIRQALLAGNFQHARQLLGRPYRMTGRVVHGNKLGRDLGYPTINIPLHRIRAPLQGIFAVRVYGVQSAAVDGVASLGFRPTVAGNDCLLEVHLFDWSGDCYGRLVEVEFIQYLRDEEKFKDVQAMKQQMHKDADMAREALSND